MRKPCRAALLALSAGLAVALSAPAQAPPAKPAAKATAKTAAPKKNALEQKVANGEVVADLEERLGQWKKVDMPFDQSKLSARERQMVAKLIEACRDLERIYWRQGDPQAIPLYRSLVHSAKASDRSLARFLWINGSHFDLLDENRPFIGKDPLPPGRAIYPEGLTRADIEAYAAAHPAEKAALLDEHTVITRTAQGGLKATPYHVAYARFLNPAAANLRAAANLSDDPLFAKFLLLRAKALLTDDFFASDLAWLDLQNPKFDIIYAPYETYLDDLLGIKTSFGAAVMIRNETESAKLAVFQKYVPDLQEALPLAPEDRPSKRGRVAPMEVMDTPYRAGDLRHGYQAVADNLPNDPRVHEQKGSKRIFFKNFLDARVDYVILPVAKLLMRPDQAAKVSADGYLAATLMHEISHGLGPAFSRQAGKQIDIRLAIGAAYSGLEEAKADVTGMFGLAWLIDKGILQKERLEEYYASYVAGIFRTVRFGVGEAHGRAEMMEWNYLTEQGAITRGEDGRYVVDYAKMPPAIASLAKELLTIEATGDRARAENWFKKYGSMPDELKTALAAAKGVPVDIDPQVPLPEGAE